MGGGVRSIIFRQIKLWGAGPGSLGISVRSRVSIPGLPGMRRIPRLWCETLWDGARA